MKRAIAYAVLAAAAPAAAHPGHGLAPESWLHAFVDPPHVWLTMAALACAAALLAVRRQARRRPAPSRALRARR